MTIYGVCAALGLTSPSSLQRWEAGFCKPGVDYAVALDRLSGGYVSVYAWAEPVDDTPKTAAA